MAEEKPSRKRRLLRLAVTLLVTLALVGLGLWLMRYAVGSLMQTIEIEVERESPPAPY